MHDQDEGSTMRSDGEAGFEDLLAKLAVSFVKIEPETLDGRVEDALRSIVLYLGIDRSTLSRLDDVHGEMMLTHSSAVEGLRPLPSPMYESAFPYLIRQMREGKPTILEKISDLRRQAAADAASLRNIISLKSIAAFPLSAEGKVLGWLSFGALRAEHAWPDRLVRRLKLIADIFANALLQRRKEEELWHALAENVALRKSLEAENAVWREQVLHRRDFDEIVGASPLLRQLMMQVKCAWIAFRESFNWLAAIETQYISVLPVTSNRL